MRQSIKLTWDMLFALLQGKDVFLAYEDNVIELSSPVDGIFLTNEQVRQIEYSAEMRVISLFQKIQNEREKHYNVEVEDKDAI